MASQVEIETAIRTFLQGHAYLESSVPGARPVEMDGLWGQFFARPVGGVVCEFFAHPAAPPFIHKTILAIASNRPHWLTVFTASPEETQRAFLSLGYHKDELEFLMSRSLGLLPCPPASIQVRHAKTQAEGEAINRSFGRPLVQPGQLSDPQLRYVYASQDGRPVSWGTSVRLGEAVYIANMYTLPHCRRRGLATAVLCEMLIEAARQGAQHSVLMSSKAGHALYLKLGYRDLLPAQGFLWAPPGPG